MPSEPLNSPKNQSLRIPQGRSDTVPLAPRVIALDLEGTLISNAVSVFPRPGLHAFLEFCRAAFEKVVLFSTVRPERLRAITQSLCDEGSTPPWFAAVERVEWSGPTKDLRFVVGFEPPEVLLVDDQERYVAPAQKGQWIPVAEFAPPYSSDDSELARIQNEILRRISPECHARGSRY